MSSGYQYQQGSRNAGRPSPSSSRQGNDTGTGTHASSTKKGYYSPSAIVANLRDFEPLPEEDDDEVAPPPRKSSYSAGTSLNGRERSATITPQSYSYSGSNSQSQSRGHHVAGNSAAGKLVSSHRQATSRSHHNLRGLASSSSASSSSASSSTTATATAGSMDGTGFDSAHSSQAPTPTASASRSRSGSLSSAKYLKVNTSGTSTPSPAPSFINDLPSDSPLAVTPTMTTSATSPVSSVHQQQATDQHTVSRKSSSRTVNDGVNTTGSGSSQQPRKQSSSTVRTSGSKVGLSSANRDEKDDREGGKSHSRSRSKSITQSKEKDKDKDGGRDAKALVPRSGRTPMWDDDVDGFRRMPRLHAHDAPSAPPTLMYWSRAPVWGHLPTHRMRSHSATVVDSNVIWLFGGCDDKSFWRDVWCLDVETMEWTRPETIGDIPPPCRAHTATLVDRKIFVFGGGQGNMYYNTLYILDTVLRRWTEVPFTDPNAIVPPTPTGASGHSHTLSAGTEDDAASARSLPSIAPSHAASSPTLTPASSVDEFVPRPRRAHTTVLYKNCLVVFGGGNGATALNDLWILEVVGVPPERMRWQKQRTTGSKPSPRGYHTANLVGNIMIVVGGSDGRQTFSDIYCLNLDTFHWSTVRAEKPHRRLAHTSTQIGSYLFIMGGHDGSQYTNELLLFNLVSLQYEPRTVKGIPPSARGYHASVLADGRLWLFGGYDARSAHDDVHMLELASSAYLSQVTGFYVNV